MSLLFTETQIDDLLIKNRLVRSATWEGIASENGSIHEDTYAIYEELTEGGVGMIITGFTGVDLHDHYFGGMMRLCDDVLIPQYRKLTDMIHQRDCAVFAQLALGGYYRNENGRYVLREPDEMQIEEVHEVVQMFADAAVRAEKAGFDGVQIHAAHFFFLSRFISPAVNHRTDEYGGTAENRCRILLDILTAVRKQTKLKIIIKINCSDRTYGGISEADCLQICRMLDEAGIDGAEISANGTSVSGIRAHVNEGYFVPAAAMIAEQVKCPVIAVGGMRSAEYMESVLQKTKIAMISLSRPLLCEPDLPKKMKADMTAVSRCISCNACYSSASHKCIFRNRGRS